tara:strand:- start:37 stop:285 length:249 start_codon:yes stop_codon:yes gene_type:complete
MQVKYKAHIMDEISSQITTASASKKRIDIITLDEHEWTEFKLYMRSRKAKEENLAAADGTDAFRINGIVIKPETIEASARIK